MHAPGGNNRAVSTPTRPSNADQAPVQPLLLAPTLIPKVWGGRRLASLGKRLPGGAAIGESWELADLGQTSASGAGGGAVRSRIEGGPLHGRPLGNAIAAWGRSLLGDVRPSPTGDFPLLVKYLDASANLSVQVHPSPAYAAAHPGASLKTESWYVVEADPGAVLYIGLAPGVSAEEFARAARAASPRLGEMLRRVPAVAGECHTLPSGTVHALGAGVTVAEVQTPSDTTFRLYDWGRDGRELHVEAALESMGDPTIGEAERRTLEEGELCGRVATTPHYTIDAARPADGDEITIGYACRHRSEGPFVLLVLGGSGQLVAADGAFAPMSVSTGQTVLVPSSIARLTRLRAARGLSVLRVGLCV